MKSLGHCSMEPFPNPHPSKPEWELQQTAWLRSSSKGTRGTALVLFNSFTNILLFFIQVNILLFRYALLWFYVTSYDTTIPTGFSFSPLLHLFANHVLSGKRLSLHLLLNMNTLTQLIYFIIFKTSSSSDYFTLNAQRTFTCNLDM